MTRLEKVARDFIAVELAKCTLEQQEFFNKLFPSGPNKDQLFSAAELIERTLDKNKCSTCQCDPCVCGQITSW